MYKLTRRKNLIPFLVLAGLGLAASVGVPTHFPDQVFEVPTMALFPAEIALVMILSVIIFENATPPELVRISFTMLAMTMFSGAISNVIAKSSQTLPDATLLLNWVQLICMNVTGLVGTTAYYQTRADVDTRPLASAAREAAARNAEHHEEEAVGHADMDGMEPATGESAKDILDKLDISRIMRLEKSLKTTTEAAQGNVSLESLFADESSSAAAAKSSEESNKARSLADLLGSDDDSGFSLDNFSTAEAEPAMVPPPPAVMAKPEYSEETTEISAMEAFAETTEIPAMAPIADLAPPPPPPPSTPDPVASPSVAATSATAGGGKLFDDVSSDIDDIFSGLAAADAQQDFTPDKLADIKPTAAEPAPATAATKGDAKLFDDVDGDIEDIFAGLAPADAQKEVGDLVSDFLSDDFLGGGASPAAPAPSPTPAPTGAPAAKAPAASAPSGPPKEVKEFGRLSVTTTAKQDLAAPGTLKTIGQMLLDTQAVENIIKRSDGTEEGTIGKNLTTARVVTASRGADIQAMLDEVANFPGIDGCLVIGKDGLLIGATQSLGMMRDVLGVLALGIHSTTNLGTKKIDMGELRQSVMLCGQKVSILTQIGIGVLAAFCDQWDLAQINSIVQHINRTVMNSEASGGADLPVDFPPVAPVAAAAVAPQPAPAPPPVPAEPEVALSIADAKGGLLSVSDDEIGDLFANVVADPTTANDSIGSHTPAAPVPVVPSGDGKPLLSVSDDEMSDIFDSLLDGMPNDVAMDFAPSEAAASASAAAPEPAPAAVADESLVDSIIGDGLFGDDLGGSEPEPVTPAPAQPPAAAPVAEASAPAAETPTPAVEAVASSPAAEATLPAAVAEAPKKPEAPKQQHQVKEFGRLSASATAQQQSEGSIKAIGRQLIDVQAVENIIKSGEKRDKIGSGLTTARVISAARGEGIKALLTKIDGTPGVQGSLIVGNDGLVIASTLTGGMDKDLLGALCTAMHSHTDLAAKKVQMGKLRQIIFHAEDKTTVLTGVAVGVLCVFVDNHDLSKIDGLLTAIETTVRG